MKSARAFLKEQGWVYIHGEGWMDISRPDTPMSIDDALVKIASMAIVECEVLRRALRKVSAKYSDEVRECARLRAIVEGENDRTV